MNHGPQSRRDVLILAACAFVATPMPVTLPAPYLASVVNNKERMLFVPPQQTHFGKKNSEHPNAPCLREIANSTRLLGFIWFLSRSCCRQHASESQTFSNGFPVSGHLGR